MKYSQILRETADRYLLDGTDIGIKFNVLSYSCIALVAHPEVRVMEHPIFGFLTKLGCNINSCSQFDEFASGEERQGARFLWLHFAALVAEDMGI